MTRLASVALALLLASGAQAQTRLVRADVAAADTFKIRIDLDLCPNGCLTKQALITRDGLVRRTARLGIPEVIVALDTIRVSPWQVDSMALAIAAAGFDTLQVPRCDTVFSDAGHVTVTVAYGRKRRSVRVAHNCPRRYKFMLSIEAAIDRVASLSSWSPGPPGTSWNPELKRWNPGPPPVTPRLPDYVALAGCYRLGHGEWQGPTRNRFEPPSQIQLGLEPGMALGRTRPGYFAMTPLLPRDVADRHGFANWRPTQRGFELSWGNGFAAMTATLTMQIDAYEGTGKVLTDVVGIEKPSVKLRAIRVACEE